MFLLFEKVTFKLLFHGFEESVQGKKRTLKNKQLGKKKRGELSVLGIPIDALNVFGHFFVGKSNNPAQILECVRGENG